jgi:hypothetical protein
LIYCGIDQSNETYPWTFQFIPDHQGFPQLISVNPDLNETIVFENNSNSAVSDLSGIRYEFEDFSQLKYYSTIDQEEPRVVELSPDSCPRNMSTSSV